MKGVIITCAALPAHLTNILHHSIICSNRLHSVLCFHDPFELALQIKVRFKNTLKSFWRELQAFDLPYVPTALCPVEIPCAALPGPGAEAVPAAEGPQ